MKYFISLALIFTSLSIQAEIYRGVDKEGNVFFTDTEQPDTKLIPTPTPNTIPMPKPEPKKSAEAKKQGALYTFFSIISPTVNATIRDSAGNISVNLSIQPELDTKSGHRIAIYLDGQAVVPATMNITEQLPNVSRGEHSLYATVIDDKGKQIISSKPITIHMKRVSSVHTKPSGTTAGPRSPEGDLYTPGPHTSEGNPYTPGPRTPEGNPYTPGPQDPNYLPGPITPPQEP